MTREPKFYHWGASALVLWAALLLAAVPAGTARDGGSAALFGLFARNLDVAAASLVPEAGGKAKGRWLNLRGRDLRFARLDPARLPPAAFDLKFDFTSLPNSVPMDASERLAFPGQFGDIDGCV